MSKKVTNLSGLINAIKKSRVFGCNQKSNSEVILWVMSVLNAFRADMDFGRNFESLRKISSDMTEDDLIRIAKEQTYHVHLQPLHALGIIYVRHMGDIPSEIVLDIIESGKDKNTSQMAVFIAMVPVMDLMIQTLKKEGDEIVMDTINVVDCGASKVTLLCSAPCPMFGHCDEFRIARAILGSKIFSRYLAKDGFMEVHDLQVEVDRIVEFCGVPQRYILLHRVKNLGKLKRIAKGLNNSSDKPSDAAYSIVDALYDNSKALDALLEIIRNGEDEPAIMVAAKGLRDFVKRVGISAVSVNDFAEIADILELLRMSQSSSDEGVIILGDHDLKEIFS